jgi:hypothetical protein
MGENKMVRLKPLDPPNGCIKGRYTTVEGLRFIAGLWLETTVEVATTVVAVREIDGNEKSPLAFDVMSIADYRVKVLAEHATATGAPPVPGARHVVELPPVPGPEALAGATTVGFMGKSTTRKSGK